jgi:hypothetical protein
LILSIEYHRNKHDPAENAFLHPLLPAKRYGCLIRAKIHRRGAENDNTENYNKPLRFLSVLCASAVKKISVRGLSLWNNQAIRHFSQRAGRTLLWRYIE